MASNKQLQELAAAFNAEINAAYGLYLDATMGFAANVRSVERTQEQKGSNDEAVFLYTSGAPADPDHMMLHQTTQGALKGRNRADGPNYVLLARFLFVLIYGLWEAGYRGRMAAAVGLERDELQSSIFGDLRLLRHEILHNKGRLSADTVERLEIVQIGSAQSVDLDRTGVERLVRHVKAGLDAIVEEYAGVDPGYRTVWRFANE